MQTFDPYKKLEQDFLVKYPSMEKMNLWSRIKSRFAPKRSVEFSEKNEALGYPISIWATVVDYQGVSYFVRWGKIK